MLEDFKIQFPEFDSDYLDLNFARFTNIYQLFYNYEYTSGTDTGKCILYLMAHLLKIDSSSNGLLASSKSDDGVSVTYTLPSSISERSMWLMSTKYGISFLGMTSTKAGAYFV
jgi:hypothetical protein